MLTHMPVKDQTAVGRVVHDSNGQSIGRITDVLFDPKTGEITHCLVSLDGILGLESKEFAIRREALAPSPGLTKHEVGDSYSIDLDREQIRFPETVSLLLV